MLPDIETSYKKIRKLVSPSAWLAGWLNLGLKSKSTLIGHVSKSHPVGLIMIQIDGLGHRQLLKACDNGDIPFIKKLLHKQYYHCYPLYSGLCSTPSMHKESYCGVNSSARYYGSKCWHDTCLIRPQDSDASQRMKNSLESQRLSLPSSGGTYNATLPGGDSEHHRCVTAEGCRVPWNDFRYWGMVFFLNIHVPIKAVISVGGEIAHLTWDGLSRGISVATTLAEIKNQLTKGLVCRVLRDLTTFSVFVDIVRGRPTIKLNYIGYNLQSQRRGPDSASAHRTLKGIDRCIEKIWNSSHRNSVRHYDVWVYSDHSHESTTPYVDLTGIHIRAAVDSAYFDVKDKPGSRAPVLKCLGSIAHLHFNNVSDYTLRTELSCQLTQKYSIPGAVVLASSGIDIYTKHGKLHLPGDEVEVFGESHPYLNKTSEDLQRLCRHPEAGDIVILGWVNGTTALSFNSEGEAHSGVGANETEAFAVIPADTVLDKNHQAPLCPHDLQSAAAKFLHPGIEQNGTLSTTAKHKRSTATLPVKRNEKHDHTLRIMTYNVHSCIGMDNVVSPERIARVISRYKPDIVALQELDVNKSRSKNMHQASHIAQLLDMDFQFHPSIREVHEQYGDAIISRLPMELVKAEALPKPAEMPGVETRGALWVTVDFYGTKVQVLNTHLGLRNKERMQQAEALLGKQWLSHPQCTGPVILCGDMNAVPSSRVLQKFGFMLEDVQAHVPKEKRNKTFSSRVPALQIDYILASKHFKTNAVEFLDSELTRVASDHLPTMASLSVK